MLLVSVNVARPRLVARQGRTYSTAIDKQAAAGAVELTETGLAGDKQADQSAHGGPDKAVCCYAREHYAFMAEQLGRPLPDSGAFGENFTTEGWLEDACCIGDVHRQIGGPVVVQITQPRQPCFKLAGKLDWPDVIRLIHHTGFSGFYLRVLTPGPVRPGDRFELDERPNPGLTVRAAMAARFDPAADRTLLERLAAAPGLSDGWREQFQERLTRPRAGDIPKD
jgi:MOSC domain-containing protein YiiM